MKVSRHILLQPTLSALADQFEELHGANFTRIVTAALFQYLVADSAADRAHYMRLCTRLERGALTLSDIQTVIATS